MLKRTVSLRLDRPSLFGLFVLISLLIHLLVGLMLQNRQILPVRTQEPEKLAVRMQERKNWLELDQKPQNKTDQPPKQADHLAESNQKVDQEKAPKGTDSRDKQPTVSHAATPPQQSPKRSPQRAQRKSPATSPAQKTPPQFQVAEQGTEPPPQKPSTEQKKIDLNLPQIKDLTQLAPTTLARLDQQQSKRVKERPEIALKDDEIWLNLQQMDNKLLSFFRRFTDRIDAVWNYPVEASSRGIEGTLLVKIVVNKKGELIDVLPLQSSGSDILDNEVKLAIYRAAPFGDLPNYYPHDQLKIYAHFQYKLSLRTIYGRP